MLLVRIHPRVDHRGGDVVGAVAGGLGGGDQGGMVGQQFLQHGLGVPRRVAVLDGREFGEGGVALRRGLAQGADALPDRSPAISEHTQVSFALTRKSL